MAQEIGQGQVLCQNDEHDQSLLRYVNHCRKEGLFNDVIVKAGKQNFHGNRMILSCFSPFFQTMFQSKMKESYEGLVEIKDFDPNAVQLLLEYIYTRNIKIDSTNALMVLAAADFMQLRKVKDVCLEFLKSQISTENCLDTIHAFTLYKPDAIPNEVYQFFSEHLGEIAQTDDFKELSEKEMLSLFQKQNRPWIKETSRFKAFNVWVKHAEETRKSAFSSLFHTINLYKLAFEFLEDVVATDPLVRDQTDCLKSVITVMAQNFKTAREQSCNHIICVGGNSLGSVDKLHSSNLFDDSAKDIPVLPHRVYYHCSVRSRNYLFCIGGTVSKELQDATNLVVRINLNDPFRKWEDMVPMKDKRCFFGVTVFQRNLLVAGGCDTSKHLSSVELFEVESHSWRYLANLNCGRSGNALVSCINCVYAIGGWGPDCLSSVECLTDLNQKWIEVKPMNTSRNCLAAVELNGFIYAIGGYSSKVEKTVERYDPIKNSWTYVCDMNIERYRHAACVFHGKICVTGGTNAKEEIVTQTECYDPITDIWTLVGATLCEYDGHALVVV